MPTLCEICVDGKINDTHKAGDLIYLCEKHLKEGQKTDDDFPTSPAQPRPSQEVMEEAELVLQMIERCSREHEGVNCVQFQVALALSRAKQEGREAALDEAIGKLEYCGPQYTQEEISKMTVEEKKQALCFNSGLQKAIASLNAMKGKGLNAKE